MVRNNYLLFNNTKMREDAMLAVKDWKETSLSRELNICGCNDSIFSNAYRNYISNKNDLDIVYAIPSDVPRMGYIEIKAYEKMIKHFGLKDKYRIPKRAEEVKPPVNEPTVPTNITQEDIKALNNNIIMLTKAIMVLADKMPVTVSTIVKPKAYLNKEN